MKLRNRTTEEGRQLGREMARLCDSAEPLARMRRPDLPPRCASCAFRDGDHTANGSPETQMDAIKCLAEGVGFQCHEPARKGAQSCSGYAMLFLTQDAPASLQRCRGIFQTSRKLRIALDLPKGTPINLVASLSLSALMAA